MRKSVLSRLEKRRERLESKLSSAAADVVQSNLNVVTLKLCDRDLMIANKLKQICREIAAAAA